MLIQLTYIEEFALITLNRPDMLNALSFAAMGLVYLTAHFALNERAAFKSGESVLITGAAGGVGLATVHIAKALGAKVIAAVGSERKAALVREAGADHVIRTDVTNLREAIRDQVFTAVGAAGVNIVIDSVGGDVFDASLRVLAWCGRMVIVGFANGRIPIIKTGYILVKNISLIGLQISDYRDREPRKMREVQGKLFSLYENNLFKPYVMSEYDLSDYSLALAAVRDRKVIGKVVIRMC